MVITAVDKSHSSFVALTLGDGTVIKLDNEVVLLSGVRPGAEITQSQLEDLMLESLQKQAVSRAMYLLQYKDHSTKSLFKRLNKDFPSHVSEAAVEKMEQIGLINNEDYAHRLARELIKNRRLSPQGAYSELLRRGVDRDLANDAVGCIPFDAAEQLQLIISQRYGDSLKDESVQRRASSYLRRRGYSWGDIHQAISSFLVGSS